MPALAKETVEKWFKKRFQPSGSVKHGAVYFFCDEFTNYNDAEIGKTAIQLLDKLGYEVKWADHEESGRASLSKGLLDQAKALAEKNVKLFHPLLSEETPLVGIEPSSLLTFRDEYPDLLRGEWQEKAKALAPHCLTIEEFLAQALEAGHLHSELFNTPAEKQLIKVHGHCHQKALSSMVPSKKILTALPNTEVHMIPSGCCGMAGSFGYEAEHYDISMKIGELVLFPTVRQQPEEVIIAAAGTSCRHQIKDGTGRKSKHPVEIIWERLK